MYNFNNDNIVTGYIKQFLKTFNLPSCTIWKPNLEVYYGNLYLYNNKLLRALDNGKFSSIDNNFVEVLRDYSYGDKILNITKNLVLDNMIYDTYTHEYLGNYLRFYRDYKGIDLMSLYNCFNYFIPQNINFGINTSTIKCVFDSSDSDYVIYAIPVKINKLYTIGIESALPIEITTNFYDKSILLENETNQIIKNTYVKLASTSFNKPFLYSKLVDNSSMFDSKRYYMQEKNLKMFLKIPSRCNTSITILEGNYIANTIYNFTNNYKSIVVPNEIDVKENSISNKYLSNLQLLNINTGTSYPFSDRLVEYLFENVITADDTIFNNTKRVQTSLLNKFIKTRDKYFKLDKTYYKFNTTTNKYDIYVNKRVGVPIKNSDKYFEKVYQYVKNYGTWDEELRSALYKIAIDENLVNTSYDLLGYCDKDMENILGGINDYE